MILFDQRTRQMLQKIAAVFGNCMITIKLYYRIAQHPFASIYELGCSPFVNKSSY